MTWVEKFLVVAGTEGVTFLPTPYGWKCKRWSDEAGTALGVDPVDALEVAYMQLKARD